MSEFDKLIDLVANEVQDLKEVNESCQKTLKNYQCINSQDAGGNSGPLKMIAWDRS